MPRRLRFSVAMSLDGYIADEQGRYAWIPMEEDIDFDAFLASIDTVVMGRKSYEVVLTEGAGPELEAKAIHVVSTTLDPADHPDVTIVTGDVEAHVRELKSGDGEDIWLFGGGKLFRSLLEAGLVDRVEVGVVPALIGRGIPLLPGVAEHARLRLHSFEEFPKSGIVLLKYDVVTPPRRATSPA